MEKAKFEIINPASFPTMPSLTALQRNCIAFITHNYIITFQKNPVSVMEYLYIQKGEKCPTPPPIEYIYSMQAYNRVDNNINISSPPILILSLEQANYSKYPVGSVFHKDCKGPIMVGFFTSEGHQTMGEYKDSLSGEYVCNKFMSVIKDVLRINDDPVKIIDTESSRLNSYKTDNNNQNKKILAMDQNKNNFSLGGSMSSIIYGIYILIGIVQMVAIYSFFSDYMGWNWIVSAIVGMIAAYTPILGTIFGMYAAVEIWAWTWLQAALLFLSPFILMILMFILSKNK